MKRTKEPWCTELSVVDAESGHHDDEDGKDRKYQIAEKLVSVLWCHSVGFSDHEKNFEKLLAASHCL